MSGQHHDHPHGAPKHAAHGHGAPARAAHTHAARAHHDHHAHDLTTAAQWPLIAAALLNFAFVIVEVVYGLLCGSVSLLADAGHNFGDALGISLAWFAASLARRRPTSRHTYGYKKATILAALANGCLLFFAVGAIGWEAVMRLRAPAPVDGQTVAWVALVGVGINSLSAWMMFRGNKNAHSDLNLRAAFLHMVSDALVSLAVALGGVALLHFGWLWLDPLLSLVVSAIILIGTWQLLRAALNLALDGVPPHIDTEAVRALLHAAPGVLSVHDLHIWSMSTTEAALSAHLVLAADFPGASPIAELTVGLRRDFGIGHATLQVEVAQVPDQNCNLASDCAK